MEVLLDDVSSQLIFARGQSRRRSLLKVVFLAQGLKEKQPDE